MLDDAEDGQDSRGGNCDGFIPSRVGSSTDVEGREQKRFNSHFARQIRVCGEIVRSSDSVASSLGEDGICSANCLMAWM
jgi:hypothetical protein